MARQSIVNGQSAVTVRAALNARLYPAAEFGAVFNGVTDDYASIQDALDTAAAAGGGIVTLKGGVARVTQVLSVPSNVHLRGVGFGSIIRFPAGAPATRTIDGIGVNACIAMVGVSNARVSNLTIDLRTNSANTNGIQIGEAGAATRSTDCVIEHCQMLAWDNHQYLAYVKCADRAKVRNNIIRGLTSGVPSSDLAGVEVFGSDGTEVYGNNIKYCAEGIIVKTQADVANSAISNIDVHDNVVDTCNNGLSVSVTSGTGNSGNNISVHDNIVSNCTNRGATLAAGASSTLTNLTLTKNTLREAANGCLVVDSDAAATTTGFLIADNAVIQTGGSSAGISVTDTANLDIIDNLLIGSPFYGISIDDGSNINILNNVIRGSQRAGIYLSDASADVLILANAIIGYGASVASPGIYSPSATAIRIHVIDNFFMYGAASSAQYAIDLQASTFCSIADNKIGWVTQAAVFTNGTNGRNNYDICGYDRNANRITRMFPREVGIGLTNTDIVTETNGLDIGGTLRIRTGGAPASASAAGSAGQIRWDAGFIYICTATNTWKRVAIATW